MAVFDRIMRAGETRILRRLESVAQQVATLDEDYRAQSDEELRAHTDQFKERYAEGEPLDDLMVEAFAVVREASRRTLGQRPFDVQVMGAAARKASATGSRRRRGRGSGAPGPSTRSHGEPGSRWS